MQLWIVSIDRNVLSKSSFKYIFQYILIKIFLNYFFNIHCIENVQFVILPHLKMYEAMEKVCIDIW